MTGSLRRVIPWPVKNRLHQIAQLIGGILIALDIRHESSAAINDHSVKGMGHQGFIGEKVHSEQIGHTPHLGHGPGQQVPGLRIRFPGLRIAGQNLRPVALRIESHREQHQVTA